MNKAIALIEKLSRVGGLLSAACIVVMTLLILTETALRLFLERSLFVAEEFSAYLMANFVMLGLAYTLREDGHIRVNLLLSRLQPSGRTLFDLIGYAVGCGIFALLTWELWCVMTDNFVTDQRSMNVTKTPIFIPQIGLVAGSVLMMMQMVAEVVKRLTELIRLKRLG
jgi:TRAP-type C4-dicarboxylate transport system permease small subunit